MIFNILFFIAVYLFVGFVVEGLFAFACGLTDTTFCADIGDPRMTAIFIVIWPFILLFMGFWVLTVIPSRVIESIYTKVYYWRRNKKIMEDI